MIGNDQLQDARLNKFLISLMLLGSLLGCSGEESVTAEKTIVETFLEDPQALGRGRALFQGSCAGQCHGVEGVEIVEAENLFDCNWQYGETDQEIFNVVTDGIPNTKMVGFGSNFPEGDNDLWKIIAFVRFKQEPCD